MQDLQRDRSVMLEVLCEVHRGHAAATEFTLEPVPVSKAVLELRKDVYHEALP